jgi:hypothetical protein
VTAFFAAPASAGTDHPKHTVFPCPGCECQCDGVTAVGQRLQDQIDAELVQVQWSYARFEAHGNQADREDAKNWLRMQEQAIAGRSAAQVARMDRVIDEGLDYFQTAGERDRRMLAARGLA